MSNKGWTALGIIIDVISIGIITYGAINMIRNGT